MLLLLPLLGGCIGTPIKFYTVVTKTGPGQGGWQEACLEARIENMTTRDSHVCKVGIGMPMETQEKGVIPSWEASEIAAECINRASEYVIRPAPPESPSALVCTSFKDALSQLMSEAVLGSRVNLGCRPGIPPSRVGF
jgi:hypothetical protein